MKRESFIFYKSFYDSIKELDPEDQVQIYDAIFKYQFEGKDIKLDKVCKSIFTLIVPQLDANNKRYENGKKGGAPKGNQNATKKQPKNNQDLTKKQPNVNDNENVNENVNVNDNVNKRFYKPTIEEINTYCIERNNGINAEAFYDFYESKNWYVGKNKMKDWKACVRTWEKRQDKNSEPVPSWFDKEQQVQIATEGEQKELEDLLKNYRKED